MAKPATALKPSRLNNLPDHVLEAIFKATYDHLDTAVGNGQNLGDRTEAARILLNIRLTSKRCNQVASALLFETLFLRLDRESVHCLNELSNHPFLAKCLKNVVFQWLTQYHPKSETFALTIADPNKLGTYEQKLNWTMKSAPGYDRKKTRRNPAKSCSSLFSTVPLDSIVTALRRFMLAAVSLDTITISCVVPFGPSALPDEDILWTKRIYGAIFGGIALRSSNSTKFSPITKLDLRTLFRTQLDTICEVTAAAPDCLRSVRIAELNFSRYKPNSTNERLSTFLSLLGPLDRLELHGVRTAPRERVECVSLDDTFGIHTGDTTTPPGTVEFLAWPNLSSVDLQTVRCSKTDLSRFIAAHGYSLDLFRLHQVEIETRDLQDSGWRDIFRVIVKECDIPRMKRLMVGMLSWCTTRTTRMRRQVTHGELCEILYFLGGGRLFPVIFGMPLPSVGWIDDAPPPLDEELLVQRVMDIS